MLPNHGCVCICNFFLLYRDSIYVVHFGTRSHFCFILLLKKFLDILYFLLGKWGYHRQGSCQAGLGAAIAENNDQVYVGAVGSWYWQGKSSFFCLKK